MKKSSADLFELVHALNRQEKRYFKLFASRHTIGDENIYVHIFNLIDAQKTYDEEEIKKAAKGLTAKNQFSAIKHYLYQMILKTLDVYYASSSMDHKLTVMLHHAEILYNKGLFDQALKVLNKAEKPAEKYERFSVLMEILNWKFRIIKTASFHKISEREIDKLYRAKKDVAEKIGNYQELGWLHTKLLSKVLKKGWFVRSKKEISRDYAPIMRHHLFKTEATALTYRSKIFYHISKSIYYYIQGKFTESYRHSSGLLRLFNENPELAKSYPDDYISGHVNAIFSAMALSNYYEALQYIKKMQEFKPESNILHAQILSASLPELVIYNSREHNEEAMKVLPEFTSRIEKYKGLMSKQEVFYFYYNFSCLYFKNKEYKMASSYLHRIINDSEVGFLPDIQANARILNLMVQFELDNQDYLPYILRSTYRFLLQAKRLYKFENAIIQFIRKLPGIDNKGLIIIFANLKEELVELSKSPYEKRAIDYFGILQWLDEKTKEA